MRLPASGFRLPALAAVLVGCLVGPVRAEDGARGLVEKAEVELEAWDIEGAAKVLEELKAKHSGTPEALWLQGRVLFENGAYDEADAAFAEAEKAGDGARFAEDRRLAHAAAEEVRGARVFESAHFVFRTRAEKDALLAPYALEALERAYASLTKDLGYQPPSKVRVEIYDSAQALAHVSPLSVAEIKASGTIALCKYNRLMVTSPRALLRGYPWLDTVSHEFVHYLVTRKGRGAVPIWLQEGLAKFLETRWRGEPGLAVDEASLVLLTRAAKTNTLIPFAKMHPSIAKLPTQEAAALAFAEVEAAIKLLYTRGGQAALTELVAAMANGFTDEQAVAQAYGKSFAAFEADWRAEVAKPRTSGTMLADGAPGQMKSARPAQTKKLVFKDDVKRRDESPAGSAPDAETLDPEAKRAVRLAELMLARRRYGAAALEYARARKLIAPDHQAVVERRYAFAQLEQGKLKEAEEALLFATRKDPSDETAQALLARVLVGKGDLEGGKAALQAGVAEDPFDPQLHDVWIALAKKAGDAALQKREETALALCFNRKLPAGETPPAGAKQSYSPDGKTTEGHP